MSRVPATFEQVPAVVALKTRCAAGHFQTAPMSAAPAAADSDNVVTNEHSGLAAVAAAAAAAASATPLMQGIPGMPAGMSHQDLMAAALMQMAIHHAQLGASMANVGFEGLAGMPRAFPPHTPGSSCHHQPRCAARGVGGSVDCVEHV